MTSVRLLLSVLIACPALASSLPATETVEESTDPVYQTASDADRLGRILVPVYINGSGPYRFVVDTGANRSVISPHLAASLGLAADPDRMLLLKGVTGEQVVPTVLVSELTAGDIRLVDQRLPVIAPAVLADAEGILGVEGFEGMCLYADITNSVVEIHRNRCPRVDSRWARTRGRLLDGRLLAVKAYIQRVKVIVIIDTGAARSLGNPRLLQALQLQDLAADPRAYAEVWGATAHRSEGQVVQTPGIRFGEVTVDNLHVTYGDFEVFELWGLVDEPAILLGMDVLGTAAAMMIDFRRAEFGILPIGGSKDPVIRSMGVPSRIER